MLDARKANLPGIAWLFEEVIRMVSERAQGCRDRWGETDPCHFGKNRGQGAHTGSGKVEGKEGLRPLVSPLVASTPAAGHQYSLGGTGDT